LLRRVGKLPDATASVPVSVRRVATPGLIEPPGASWTNCMVIGQEVVLSGVTARGSDGTPIGGANAGLQTKAIFNRIAAQLNAAGGDLCNVYKLVIYVTDMRFKDEVNAVRAAAFQPLYPASTFIAVNRFTFPDLLVEIDAFANLAVNLHNAGA
jgi:2-iminobutanoate/2-iminopropanoate deaminase